MKPSFNLNLSTCYSTYLNFTFTLLSFQLNDNHLQFILYYYQGIYLPLVHLLHAYTSMSFFQKRSNNSYSFQSHISHELSSNSTILIPRVGERKNKIFPAIPLFKYTRNVLKTKITPQENVRKLPPSSIFPFTPASKRTALLPDINDFLSLLLPRLDATRFDSSVEGRRAFDFNAGLKR